MLEVELVDSIVVCVGASGVRMVVVVWSKGKLMPPYSGTHAVQAAAAGRGVVRWVDQSQ